MSSVSGAATSACCSSASLLGSGGVANDTPRSAPMLSPGGVLTNRPPSAPLLSPGGVAGGSCLSSQLNSLRWPRAASSTLCSSSAPSVLLDRACKQRFCV